MSTLRNTVIIFFNIIALKQINSTPIIPLSLSFGKLPQLSIEDTDASIGPGLGGSPILVNTRPHNYNRYLYETVKNVSYSRTKNLIRVVLRNK